MAEEPLYIGIQDPISLRKSLLLCSRDVISSLKNYEMYKGISAETTETVFELRKVMEELVVLNRKLRQALPKTRQIKPLEMKEGKEISKKTITKFQDLEKALDKIEDKLKTIK